MGGLRLNGVLPPASAIQPVACVPNRVNRWRPPRRGSSVDVRGPPPTSDREPPFQELSAEDIVVRRRGVRFGGQEGAVENPVEMLRAALEIVYIFLVVCLSVAPIAVGAYALFFSRKLSLRMLRNRQAVWRIGYSESDVRVGQRFAQFLGAVLIVGGLIVSGQFLLKFFSAP
jgi:hypothetical protein